MVLTGGALSQEGAPLIFLHSLFNSVQYLFTKEASMLQ
jgi:hypothetical protein